MGIHIVPSFTIINAGAAIAIAVLFISIMSLVKNPYPRYSTFLKINKKLQPDMYATILAIHSLVRWFVLASLLFAIAKAYKGWISKKAFTKFDNAIRHWTATIAHIQLMLGLWLYLISPLVNYFLNNYKAAVHQREIRFFGMEHSIMMMIGIVVITIGSAKAKRKLADRDKFKTMAIWYTIGLLIIVTSIPWGFSPLVSRPYLR